MTAKKYIVGGNALELSLGGTSFFHTNYRDDFYENDKYRDYEYVGYARRSAIAFQVHYLFQKNISGVENFQWYWGLGGQFRSRAHQYSYRYKSYWGPGQGDYIWVYDSDKVSDIDFGADAVIGLEYHIPRAPVSIHRSDAHARALR